MEIPLTCKMMEPQAHLEVSRAKTDRHIQTDPTIQATTSWVPYLGTALHSILPICRCRKHPFFPHLQHLLFFWQPHFPNFAELQNPPGILISFSIFKETLW